MKDGKARDAGAAAAGGTGDAPRPSIDATGDIVAGDVIEFREAVWRGYAGRSRFGRSSRPEKIGERTILAEVVRDSYGADRQQHTFTLRVIRCAGDEAIGRGRTIRRKGRNVYREGVLRCAWPDEEARAAALGEKHARGAAAREARADRRGDWP